MKKATVSLCSVQPPPQYQIREIDFGSSLRIILTRMYPSSAHHSASIMSMEKIAPNARVDENSTAIDVRTWARRPPPSSRAIIPDTKIKHESTKADATWIDRSESEADQIQECGNQSDQRRKIDIAKSKMLPADNVVQFIPKVSIIRRKDNVNQETDRSYVENNRSIASPGWCSLLFCL